MQGLRWVCTRKNLNLDDDKGTEGNRRQAGEWTVARRPHFFVLIAYAEGNKIDRVRSA